jgi:hypothetical protein
MNSQVTTTEADFESGVSISLHRGLSFVHLEHAEHSAVDIDRTHPATPVVAVDFHHLIGDFPSADLTVFMSLGQALAIGAVAGAEYARIAESAGGAGEGLQRVPMPPLDNGPTPGAHVLQPDQLLDALTEPRFAVVELESPPYQRPAWIVVDGLTGANAVRTPGLLRASESPYPTWDAAKRTADDLNALDALGRRGGATLGGVS